MSEAETVEGEQGSEGDDDEPDIIKKTNLRQLLRDEADLQVSKDSRDEVMKKLNELTIVIWGQAVEIASRNDRGTVQKQDVEDAYQQVLKPHNLLHRAVDKVEKVQGDLEDIANESPLTSGVDADE